MKEYEMQKQEILLESGTNEMEILTFLLGSQPFGINVSKVQAIIGYDPKDVTKIPNAHEAMLGMLLYRDRTIPLIDLPHAMDMESGVAGSRQIIIVTEFNNSVNGFRVDGVERIHRLSWSDFVPVGSFFSGPETSIVGSVHIEDTEILIADMELILSKIFPGLAFEEATDETIGHVEKTKREDVHICFAEDSAIIRKNVIRILSDAGYTNVEAFDNGQAAYEMLVKVSENNTMDQNDSRYPNMILSDIEMPKMDGLTLCRKVKSELGMNHIPVIMFSSLINDQMITKCNSVGADGYVTKPEMNKLITMVDGICLKKEP
jgi:two-component system, chemotaxis family, chemotaxis protein CheV